MNLQTPNVFNGTDLQMGETWPVIERVAGQKEDGEKVELVPFNGRDGQRGWCHLSDILYFGNSVGWRRRQIGKTSVEYNAPGKDGRWRIEEIICADYRLQIGSGKQRYRVGIWRDHSASSETKAPERFVKKLDYVFEVVVLNAKVIHRSDAR